MSISEIVDVQISLEVATVSQDGFGTPLCVGYHDNWPEVIRTYAADSADSALASEGFGARHPVRRMVAAVLRQQPHPTTVKVGRLPLPAAPFTATLPVSPDVVEGDTVSALVDLPSGTTAAVSYVLAPADTPALAATALAALVNALADMAAVAVGADINVTADNNGEIPFFRSLVNLGFSNTTVDWGYAAALDAIELADPDFYCSHIDCNSPLNLDVAISWTEAKPRLFLGHFAGSKAAYVAWLATHGAEHRSAVIYADPENDYLYPGATWAAYGLAQDPGSVTWAFKSLPGVPVSTVNANDRAAIKAAFGNTYRRIQGVDITQDGWALSGRFLDITHAIDWLTARTRERVYGFIVAKKKVPYTDASVDQVRGEILAVLGQAVGTNVLRADPAPYVTAPRVADIAPAIRASRLLPDIKFFAELAGAIHAVTIRGTLTV